VKENKALNEANHIKAKSTY